MDQQPPRPTENFIPRLEALRGVAALIVAASHIGTIPVGDGHMLVANPRPVDSVVVGFLLRTSVHLTDGLQAVSLFFVLSGFVLTLALSRGGTEPALLSCRFAIARLFRIYPAVIASVAVFAVALLVTGSQPRLTLGRVVADMLLLDTSLNGVMWSLQLEVLAMPLILTVYLVRLRWSRQAVHVVAILALLLVALSFTGSWTRLLAPFGPPLGPSYAFLFGVLIADAGPRIAPMLTTRRATLAATAAIALFFAARPVLGPASNWRMIANAYGAAALILIVSYGPQIRLLSVLDTRVLRFLGRVSYSFYLLHPLTLIALSQVSAVLVFLLDLGVPELVLAPTLLAISTAIAAALAGISYAHVERPGIAAGRALIRRMGVKSRPDPA
jgi:peptidoglycan/LPS O-acetylase OafA/YrhL